MPERNKQPPRALVHRSADDKENARLIVSQIVLEALKDLKMAYPRTTAKRERELKSIRKLLTAKSPSESKKG